MIQTLPCTSHDTLSNSCLCFEIVSSFSTWVVKFSSTVFLKLRNIGLSFWVLALSWAKVRAKKKKKNVALIMDLLVWWCLHFWNLEAINLEVLPVEKLPRQISAVLVFKCNNKAPCRDYCIALVFKIIKCTAESGRVSYISKFTYSVMNNIGISRGTT